MKNDTLKEYYVKLEGLWNNVTNILSAINQSLHSSSSEVSVQITDSYNNTSIVRIPSFLYLENKLENLSNNFSNLFNIPESGEAWFNSNDANNMYKLELVRANIAPLTPNVNTTDIVASITDNNFLRDLVSPKTFLRLNVDNLPDNITDMFMKKYIIHNYSVFESLRSANIKSYDEFLSYIYNLKNGVDYEEYDSVIKTPIKSDLYKSQFKIINIPNNTENPWIDVTNSNSSKYSYKLELDTLKYIHSEDSSIEFTLKAGDKLSIGKNMTIYKVKYVNNTNNSIIIEEEVGHTALQTFEENNEMILSLYNNDYSKYHFVDVPLEENPYICVFLGTIYNNVRSLLSAPILLNLNEVFITDKNGQYIYDSNGNKLTYIEYYKKECTNIGDLILGLTQSAYPQLTLLDSYKLQLLQTDSTLKSLINKSISDTGILQVTPINKHIMDNTQTEEVLSLHAQKNEISSQLVAVNNSISTVNNTLVSTDFTQEVAVTYQSLQTQLKQHYNERVLLQKQLIAVVENINSNVTKLVGNSIKYRIRGICNVADIDNYIHNAIDPKLDIIGIDVEYKYKSINKQTTSVSSINSNIFTDWNKLVTIDKQRIIKFDSITNSYTLEFENYDSTNNIIKWNQIDIPIVAEEDVIVRIRYKFNIGQPFVNIYSEWSDELTVVFPIDFKDNVEINSIYKENTNDIISAKFNNTLINDGYQEHINNALIVSDSIFYHMPENIYSGFNTAENKLISLKDKLMSLSNEVNEYTKLIAETINQKVGVYLTYDDQYIQMFDTTTNIVNIYNDDHVSDTFVKKSMSIVIKNNGEVPIKLYSIFPGNINTPLLLCNDMFYEKSIINYERVPMIINNQISYQRLGQWIYFRQNNFWTGESIYKESNFQNEKDFDLAVYYNAKLKPVVSYNITSSTEFGSTIYEERNNQPLLGFRKRNTGHTVVYQNRWLGYLKDEDGKIHQLEAVDANENVELTDCYKNIPIDFFIYENIANNYILRYEDIFYKTKNNERIYLDSKTSLQEFINESAKNGNMGSFINLNDYIGAFLYPDILNGNMLLTNGGVYDYLELGVGQSISVPITLEYFINNSVPNTTIKSLFFDIKTSLYKEVSHYLLEIHLNKDNSSSNNMISNVSLYDETIAY